MGYGVFANIRGELVSAIRIAVLDDHPIVADAIALLLQQARLSVLINARTFEELQTAITAARVDVCILDLHGVKSSPLAMVRWMRTNTPWTRLIIFSSTMDVAPELLQAGVHGYVLKEEMVSLLVDAIDAVHRGEQFLSPAVNHYVRNAGRREEFDLMPREVFVLSLLSQGKTTVQIAQDMGIEARTVQNYITSLLKKTGCNSRTILVLWYQQWEHNQTSRLG